MTDTSLTTEQLQGIHERLDKVAGGRWPNTDWQQSHTEVRNRPGPPLVRCETAAVAAFVANAPREALLAHVFYLEDSFGYARTYIGALESRVSADDMEAAVAEANGYPELDTEADDG